MARFNDFREPVEYIVDQYFQKKKTIYANKDKESGYIPGGGVDINDNLPEVPVTLIRDNTGKAYKFIYGNVDALLNEDEEADPIIWQEELIRDDDGKAIAVTITYPDGAEVTNEFIRDEKGKLKQFK